MMRIVVLVLALLAVLLLLRRALRRRGGGEADTTGPDDEQEALVACARCGLLVPRRSAPVDAQGRGYCGEAHRRLGPPRH